MFENGQNDMNNIGSQYENQAVNDNYSVSGVESVTKKGKIPVTVTTNDGSRSTFRFTLNVAGRKIGKLKKKNLKHLIKAAGATLYSEALKIKRGESFGNERLKKAIIRATQNQ